MEDNQENRSAGEAEDKSNPAGMGGMARFARMSTLKPDEVDEIDDVEDAIEESEYWDEEPEIEEYDSEAEDGEVEDYDYSEEESTELAETDSDDEPEKPEKKEPVHLEHSGEIITLVSTPTTEDMFRFMLRHTYGCFVGVMGLLISLSAIVMLIIGYGRGNLFTTLLMVFVALMFTVINPFNLYLRAKKQVSRANSPETAISYTVSNAGIDMTRNGEYVAFKWERILKVYEGKTGFYVYLAPNQAFILPFRNFSDRIDNMREIIVRNLNDPRKSKVKKVA